MSASVVVAHAQIKMKSPQGFKCAPCPKQRCATGRTRRAFPDMVVPSAHHRDLTSPGRGSRGRAWGANTRRGAGSHTTHTHHTRGVRPVRVTACGRREHKLCSVICEDSGDLRGTRHASSFPGLSITALHTPYRVHAQSTLTSHSIVKHVTRTLACATVQDHRPQGAQCADCILGSCAVQIGSHMPSPTISLLYQT